MKYKIKEMLAQENYIRLMNTAKLFKCKIEDIIDNNYKSVRKTIN